MFATVLILLRGAAIASLGLHAAAQYTAIPRWGQAVAVIDDTLFVHGGKTDPYNQYTYTSAPTTNDLLYLALSRPFAASSPPWQLLSNSSNTTFSESPTLAWHTLSAFNTSHILSFGGDPGPNGTPPITTLPDSGALLDVFDRLQPLWISETQSWANEPMRRVHHSACESGGDIWIVGGEKDDGSGTALSDHWVFDPSGPSFTQLPTENGPPDLYGHACVILSNGTMLVFGGFSDSMDTLLPLTTIWMLDTTQVILTWEMLTLTGSTSPSPRRDFAVAMMTGGQMFIQGGADAVLQNVYSDGWMIDTTQNPMVWTAVDALSQLGPRYDHFATGVGTQVIFGFGFGSTTGASASLEIYDSVSGSFVPTFTPVTIPTTNTLPTPYSTQSQAASTRSTTPTSLGGSTAHYTATGTSGISSIHPTKTQSSTQSSTPTGITDTSEKKATTAIAIGTVIGALALVAGAIAAGYYVRHHKQYPRGGDGGDGTFRLLGGEGSENGDLLPAGSTALAAGAAAAVGVSAANREKLRSGPSAWLFANNANSDKERADGAPAAVARTLANTGRRRDMFADEDTRNFGMEFGYGYGNPVRREGSGGSSWSLQSVGAAIGSVGTGLRGMLSRENSETAGQSHERLGSDTFAEGPVLMHDGGIGPYVTSRPSNRKQTSYGSATRSYHDPFTDGPSEEAGLFNEPITEADEENIHDQPTASRISLPPLYTLPPLTEQTSHSTVTTGQTSSSSSHGLRSTPFDSDLSSSATSYELRPQRRSSIINSNLSRPTEPLKRSDTWWARFANTSFLDRRSTRGKSNPKSPTMMALDFRDPNPAPRLSAIQEASGHSQSPESPTGSQSRRRGSHRKSLSSMRTAKTADSEVIERMGGMDVVQRMGTQGSHQTTPSTGGRDTPDSDRDPSWINGRPLSVVASSDRSETSGSQTRIASEPSIESPVNMHEASDNFGRDSAIYNFNYVANALPNKPTPQRPTSGANVADRIHAYERRMSQDNDGPGSPVSPGNRNTRKREEFPSKSRVSVNYGLAPRPSLFVANPDHKGSPSSES